MITAAIIIGAFVVYSIVGSIIAYIAARWGADDPVTYGMLWPFAAPLAIAVLVCIGPMALAAHIGRRVK